MLSKLKIYAIIAGISLLINLAMFGFGVFKGYDWGSDAKQAEWNASKLKGVNEKIKTKVVQDEIQIAPIDGNVTNRRLFNETF